MTKDELAVYKLIKLQFVAQFLGCHEYLQRKVVVICQNESFSAHCNSVKVPGWKQSVLKSRKEIAQEQELPLNIPDLKENEAVLMLESDIIPKQTKPPARFSEGTLISAMKNIAKFVDDPSHKKTLNESAGIGTEATRADIIEKLLKRDYIKREKNILVSTQRGRKLIELLPEQIKNPVTTAIWEQELDNIAEGKGDLKNFLLDQEEVLEFMLEDLSQSRKEKSEVIEVAPQHPCPQCQSTMVRRKGKNGFFWGCSHYPKCTALLKDKNGNPDSLCIKLGEVE